MDRLSSEHLLKSSGQSLRSLVAETSEALLIACGCHKTDAQLASKDGRTERRFALDKNDDSEQNAAAQDSSVNNSIYGSSSRPPVLIRNNRYKEENGAIADRINMMTGSFELQPFDSIICDIDASSSMGDYVGSVGTRLRLVQNGLDYLVDHRDRTVPFEVRAFGTGRDCTSSYVLVDLDEHRSDNEIKRAINGLAPTGGTPLAYSIHACVDDANKQNVSTPVLIVGTDGGEGCNGDVCAEVERFFTNFPKGQLIVMGIDPSALNSFLCDSLATYSNQIHLIDATNPEVTLVNIQDKMNDVRVRMRLNRQGPSKFSIDNQKEEDSMQSMDKMIENRKRGITETHIEDSGRSYKTKLHGQVLPRSNSNSDASTENGGSSN